MNKPYLGCLVFFLLLLSGCNKKNSELNNGLWRGVLVIQGQDLPFNFEVKKNNTIDIINGDERLSLDSIYYKKDSIIIPLHLFDARIEAKINEKKLKGYFVKNYVADYRIPFEAELGKTFRFEEKGKGKSLLAKKYKIHFADKPDSTYVIGVFNTANKQVTGTVLTTSGDQRYLAGQISEDSLFLSSFNGENAYLYKIKINPDATISGKFYSGKKYNTLLSGLANDSIELPDANALTFLNPGVEKIAFNFPGINNKNISLEDAVYKNKVIVIQILGSWCPNCMDESKFLAPWYEKNKKRGVEIIGLGYEKKSDLEYAKTRLTRMRDRLQIKYAIAVGGSSDSDSVRKSLPMIRGVTAFPTTIFLDKKGKVRKIHTGFTGPGTGKYYDDFVKEFNETMDGLLKEK